VHDTDWELVEEAACRRHPHVDMATVGRYNLVPIAAPASASMQPSCRHGKSSMLSGKLLHAATVLGGGDVVESLNHVR
jgi:hypothetical protein